MPANPSRGGRAAKNITPIDKKEKRRGLRKIEQPDAVFTKTRKAAKPSKG